MTKEKMGKIWLGLQRGLGAFTPGTSIKLSSGGYVDVSSNGTTSVSSDQLAKTVRKRFGEMRPEKKDGAA